MKTQNAQHQHSWEEIETLAYGPIGRASIYQCQICAEKKYRDHTPKRGD